MTRSLVASLSLLLLPVLGDGVFPFPHSLLTLNCLSTVESEIPHSSSATAEVGERGLLPTPGVPVGHSRPILNKWPDAVVPVPTPSEQEGICPD